MKRAKQPASQRGDLDTLASRGVIHPRNAARRKSRLMKQLARLVS